MTDVVERMAGVINAFDMTVDGRCGMYERGVTIWFAGGKSFATEESARWHLSKMRARAALDALAESVTPEAAGVALKAFDNVIVLTREEKMQRAIAAALRSMEEG